MMINCSSIRHILYGGDYNPEQWPEETWEEDLRLLRQAGVNILTLNVFSWAALQPNESAYDFAKLDRIMNMVRDHGFLVCMSTSTAAHPAWMAKKYPDILRTEFGGRKRKFGGRHNSCPNSLTYRHYAAALARRLAERYGTYDNIVAWHISNEFGGACYCEHCEAQFREWLQKRYGTLEELNRVWNTSFWGHTFYDWDEIVLPDTRSEHIDKRRTMFQGISLDYNRFMSDSILACYELERDAVKAVLPDAQVTTNLMGFYKGLDYQKWAGEMDFISWDNYPSNEDSFADIAMAHDLMRGIKQGKPFALMEQTPSVTNWLPYNALKRPGDMRLWSYQAMAHGADTVMFFQMKRSIGACEKLHGAFIDHVGTSETRVYREAAALGEELHRLGDCTLGGRTPAKIGMLFDWDTWWSAEFSAGPSMELRYLTEFGQYYRALREMGYDIDIISPKDCFDPYRVLIAPEWYMVRSGEDEAVRTFTSNGGSFVMTFFSGIVQENDLVTLGGYPGKLRDILGIWVEESDALPHGRQNSFVYRGRTYPALLLCDLLHLEGAQQLDENGYHTDFYRGLPVVTKNTFGKGCAYYVATASKPDFYRHFLSDVCKEAGVQPVLDVPEGVEVTSRKTQTEELVYVLNHTMDTKTVCLPWNATELICGEIHQGTTIVPPKGVLILKREG